jgi:hypothetical protein
VRRLLQALLDNTVFKLVLEEQQRLASESLSTLRNSDPHTKPSDIARAQGQLEALALLDKSRLKSFEAIAKEQIKAKTNPRIEEDN